MLRPEIPREIGFLDETFFLYWDEKDYWQRTIRGGYRVVYVPTEGRVLHKGGASTAKLMSHSSYLYLRNEFLFRRRYPTRGGSLPRLALKTALRILKWRVNPGWGIRAFVDGLALWIRNPSPRWRFACCDPSPRQGGPSVSILQE